MKIKDMKNTSCHISIPAALIAGLMTIGASWAVDLPAPDKQPKPELDGLTGKPNQPEAMPMVGAAAEEDAEDVAYLGVGAAAVPELLSIHLGLKDGQGVVVRVVDPDGPAAAAGIHENDILLKVNDQAVGSQMELRDAVLAGKPGDEVKLDLVHEGKPVHKAAKLGSRPATAMPGVGMPPFGEGAEEQAKQVREAIEQNLKAMQGMDKRKMAENMKRIEKRMEFMFRGLGGEDLDDADADAVDGQALTAATIRMMDGEGSVSIETKNGSKHVRVSDPDGKLQWEGPWDTAQDKAAAPKEIRDRIEELGSGMGMIGGGGPGGIQLHIGPMGPGFQPPEDEDEDAPIQEDEGK